MFHQSSVYPSTHPSTPVYPSTHQSVLSVPNHPIHPSTHPSIHSAIIHPSGNIYTKQVLGLEKPQIRCHIPAFTINWKPSHKEIVQHNVTKLNMSRFSKKLLEGLQFRFSFQLHLPPCELKIRNAFINPILKSQTALCFKW